jgi:hypothetical protein
MDPHLVVPLAQRQLSVHDYRLAIVKAWRFREQAHL